MKKEKYLKTKRRQARRGAYERSRKNKQHRITKPILQARKQEMPKMSLKAKIIYYCWTRPKLFIEQEILCKIGIHNWKLCSGLEGDSKYTCIRCWSKSKEKWGKRASKEYYEEKAEIANPENWEKKEDGYYFKGKLIELTEEEVRRLKVILEQMKETMKV